MRGVTRDEFGPDVAAGYDVASAAMFAPEVVEPAVGFLAELVEVASAGTGAAALELGIGTGRIALPLSRRGIRVHGIDLSPAMVEQLRAKPGADAVGVTIGDMASARAPGTFSLVYVVWNALSNLTTQDEQVAVFVNAADHLDPGGCFVVELEPPQLHRLVPGELGRVFALAPGHVGIDTFDDPVAQVVTSHHLISLDGRWVRHDAAFRYVWPAELDLMARVAGLRLRHRWAGWAGQPFTGDSTEQVAVYEKPA